MKKTIILLTSVLLITIHIITMAQQNQYFKKDRQDAVNVDEADLKKSLSKDVFEVTRRQATERPYTGKYVDFKEDGYYYCIVCGNKLFSSKTKFDSHCGWPSFYDEEKKGNIIYKKDNSYDMSRTEIICAKCKSHLGHIFDDGPLPTNKRFCVNSASIIFDK